MNHSLKEFSIYNLYGERNVKIDFDSNVKIIVAENGFGKTTVLNAFYAVLARDLNKLRKIPFESISLKFQDGDEVHLSKKSMAIDLSNASKSGICQHLSSLLSKDEIYNLINMHRTLQWPQLKRQSCFVHAKNKFKIDDFSLKSWLEMLDGELGDDTLQTKAAKAAFKKLKNKFSLGILYLPTYRRVEEDLMNLGIYEDGEVEYNHQINFGMADVEDRIEKITKEIKNSSVEWFSKVNGEMISQLSENFEIDDEMQKSVQNLETVQIVLARIGENIKEDIKQNIVELVTTGKISKGHEPLVYFLSKLVKVYEHQKENDAAIQSFTNICNEYLVDKKIFYNKSKVTISVIRKKNEKPVDWENLSSGEKQIVSLFARLYLDKADNLAIFFDEPELSLSIEWQRLLLPHILKSNKCKFLFCTTHSPFIFENELDGSVSDLSLYVEEL